MFCTRTTKEKAKHHQNGQQSFHDGDVAELNKKYERTASQLEIEVFFGNLSITLTPKISANFTTVKITETHRKVGFGV